MAESSINPNDNKGFLREFTISGASTKVFTHKDGDNGITVSRRHLKNEYYISMHDQKVFFNQRNLDHIKTLKADHANATNQLMFKELKPDNATEPIITNDKGLTLDAHTQIQRPTNHNSIRWFNGDLVNGIARLKISTGDRLRLSTFKGKDGVHTMKNGNRDYTKAKAQFIELLLTLTRCQ